MEPIFCDTLRIFARREEIAQSCYYGIMSLGYEPRPSEIISTSVAVQNNTEFKEWQDLMTPANGAKTEKPIQIVQWLNGKAVLPRITIDSYNDTCNHGNEAHSRLYAAMDHTDVLMASFVKWMAFIRDRFDNKSTNKECSNITLMLFDEVHLVVEAEADEIASLFEWSHRFAFGQKLYIEEVECNVLVII